MKRVEVVTEKFQCKHCGRVFSDPGYCLDHESFCQTSDPARELAKRLSDLLALATQNGITVLSEYVMKNVGRAEFNESMGEIYLLPLEG